MATIALDDGLVERATFANKIEHEPDYEHKSLRRRGRKRRASATPFVASSG